MLSAMHRTTIARRVHRIALGAGVAAALAMPLAPAAYRWLNPPTPPVPTDHALGALALLFNTFMVIGDSIAIYVWVLGLALAAVTASLVALIAALIARENTRSRWLCGVPLVTALASYGLLILVYD